MLTEFGTIQLSFLTEIFINKPLPQTKANVYSINLEYEKGDPKIFLDDL